MDSSILQAVKRHRIIVILRGVKPDQVLTTAEALYEGGIRLLEITFNQSSPAKLETASRSIRAVREAMGGKLLVGAGTVLTAEEVKTAHEAGASYILAPDCNPVVIAAANALGMAAIPGAMTPTEIAVAHNAGAAFVKLFPAGDLGPGYIKAVTAPLSHIPLLAVGGVDVLNLNDYLQAGAIGVGIGSNIADQKFIDAGEYGKLTAQARAYVNAAERHITKSI